MRRTLSLAVLVACGRTPARTTGLTWIQSDEPVAFARARATHRGVLINFDAMWSMPSVELTRNLGDPTIAGEITDNFVALRFDVSNGTDADDALRTKYHSQTLPMVLLLASDGTVVGRIDRSLDLAELEGALELAIVGLHRQQQARR